MGAQDGHLLKIQLQATFGFILDLELPHTFQESLTDFLQISWPSGLRKQEYSNKKWFLGNFG